MGEFEGRFAFTVGSVTGTRVFNVDADGWLTGYTFRSRWVEGVNDAACLRTKTVPCVHRAQSTPQDLRRWCGCPQPVVADPCGGAPGADCKCGFYGYYEGSNDYASPDTVAAVVEGFGRTVVGTRGFRASKARIRALYLPPAGTTPRPPAAPGQLTTGGGLAAGAVLGPATQALHAQIPTPPMKNGRYTDWEHDFTDRYPHHATWGTVFAAGVSFAVFQAATTGQPVWWVCAAVWAASTAICVFDLWDIRQARQVRAGHRAHACTVRQRRARRARARDQNTTATHVAQALSHAMATLFGHIDPHTAGCELDDTLRAKVHANYPNIPIFDDLDEMVAAFPPNPGTPQED